MWKYFKKENYKKLYPDLDKLTNTFDESVIFIHLDDTLWYIYTKKILSRSTADDQK